MMMQAESKALAVRYNAALRTLLEGGKFDRRAPQPMKFKCVDMLEASLVVFSDRPGKPAYFMEAYIEGVFEKHNGNAGFVGSPAGMGHETVLQCRLETRSL